MTKAEKLAILRENEAAETRLLNTIATFAPAIRAAAEPVARRARASRYALRRALESLDAQPEEEP